MLGAPPSGRQRGETSRKHLGEQAPAQRRCLCKKVHTEGGDTAKVFGSLAGDNNTGWNSAYAHCRVKVLRPSALPGRQWQFTIQNDQHHTTSGATKHVPGALA